MIWGLRRKIGGRPAQMGALPETKPCALGLDIHLLKRDEGLSGVPDFFNPQQPKAFKG